MKKIVVVILSVLLLICSNAACRVREAYGFINPSESIINISIVKLSFENEELLQTTVATVDDTSLFLADFRKIKCYVYFGDPSGITPEGISDTVIKIDYENSEYELINWNGQARYTIEGGFNYYYGFNIFDEEQFEALIEKYS